MSTPAHARYLSARLVVSVIACLDPRSAARPAAPRYDFDYIARYGTRRLVARATASIPAFASTSDPPRARGLIPAPDSLTRSTLYFCSTPCTGPSARCPPSLPSARKFARHVIGFPGSRLYGFRLRYFLSHSVLPFHLGPFCGYIYVERPLPNLVPRIPFTLSPLSPDCGCSRFPRLHLLVCLSVCLSIACSRLATRTFSQPVSLPPV